MTAVVEVLDSIMGSGKTTAVMNWMRNNQANRYIYISPMLSEVEERLPNALPEMNFATPSDDGKTKSNDLLRLLKDGRNIGATHALFKLMTQEHMEYIAHFGYVVIVDEELEMIRPCSEYTRSDFAWTYKKGFTSVNDNGQVVWNDDTLLEDTQYSLMRSMCDMGMLFSAKRDPCMVTVQLPTQLITCAKRFIVLTYLFEGSVFDKFLRMKNIPTKAFTEVDGELSVVPKERLRELIELVGVEQSRKINRKMPDTGFASGWYNNYKNDLDIVSTYIKNACRVGRAKAEDVIWTAKGVCSSEQLSRDGRLIKPVGYTYYKEDGDKHPCWIACNTRSTNKYQDRWMLVHCYNRYPHMVTAAFLQDSGYPVDTGRFALSEMLQWIWRSRIRKGEPIKLAILPKRMYSLFMDWLHDRDSKK